MEEKHKGQLETLGRIKETLQTFVGCKMRFRTNLGRCRILEKEGVLEALHPNIFVIRLEEDDCDRRISYSYTDILTRLVQLCDPSTDDDFFSWLN